MKWACSQTTLFTETEGAIETTAGHVYGPLGKASSATVKGGAVGVKINQGSGKGSAMILDTRASDQVAGKEADRRRAGGAGWAWVRLEKHLLGLEGQKAGTSAHRTANSVSIPCAFQPFSCTLFVLKTKVLGNQRFVCYFFFVFV